jgi:hypothetical protein
MMKKRKRIIEELICTETTYIDSLVRALQVPLRSFFRLCVLAVVSCVVCVRVRECVRAWFVACGELM